MVDAELLRDYVDSHDPAAFQELVDRHGSAVLRTCRQWLSDPHAVDDAFQATFLLLHRRATSIEDPERLRGWLIGAARKISVRARQSQALQRRRENRWAEARPIEEDTRPIDELRTFVREELERLPSAYRRILTLCYFDGLSHEEAAIKLGCPVGTVKGRLARARRMLRERLDRRGVALSIAFLMLLLLERESVASMVSLTNPGVSGPLAPRPPAPSIQLPRSMRKPQVSPVESSLARLGWLRGVWLIVLLVATTVAGGVAVSRAVASSQAEAERASAGLTRLLDAECR
jgi:RNA polymerase sigma factor (sigma-70 family)